MISGEPKLRDFGVQELTGARLGSGEPKMHDFGVPELPGARPGSGEPKCLISVYRSCQEPDLAPVNQKWRTFGLPDLPGASTPFATTCPWSTATPDLAPVNK